MEKEKVEVKLIDNAEMLVAQAEILRRVSTDELLDDQMHEFFEKFCPDRDADSDWCGVLDEAMRLLPLMQNTTGYEDDVNYYMRSLIAAVAAEAYHRGIRNAADYLGVDRLDLEYGCAEFVEGARTAAVGLTIPRIDYAHD